MLLAVGLPILLGGIDRTVFALGIMTGGMLTVGGLGLITNRSWGRQILTGGLVAAASVFAIVALFGFIIGDAGKDFVAPVSWAASGLSALFLALSFWLHSSKVSRYLWWVRIAEADASDS